MTANPAEKLSLKQFRILLAAGYTPEQIGHMNRLEIEQEVKIALDQSVILDDCEVENSQG